MRWQRRRPLCRRAGGGGARGNTGCGVARCWRLTTGRGVAFSPRCDLAFHSHPGGSRHGAPRAMAHRARMIIVDKSYQLNGSDVQRSDFETIQHLGLDTD